MAPSPATILPCALVALRNGTVATWRRGFHDDYHHFEFAALRYGRMQLRGEMAR